MTILIFFIVSYILLSISLYFLFPKANVEAWKGLVPGLNFMEWCDIIGRPKWWALLLLVPIVGFFIFAGMAVDMVRSFKKYELKHSAAAVAYAPAIFSKIAFDKEDAYVGKTLEIEAEYYSRIEAAKEKGDKRELGKLNRENPYKKSGGREWIESIFFAVFAAAFIRMFLIEAYVIPTPSMEGSLLVGDFLFVSKAHYGIRTPMTPVMVPLLHNMIPGLGTESYLKKPSLPYYRMEALESIDNNDLIVFNWPVGDSVYITSKRSYTVNQPIRNPEMRKRDRELNRKVQNKDFKVRPVDKKDHYIKRCIGKPGDSLQIRNKQVYINGQKAKNPKHMQFFYNLKSPITISEEELDDMGIDAMDMESYDGQVAGFHLDQEQYDKLTAKGVQLSLYNNRSEASRLFPHDPKHFPKWSVDNYGPIWIPKKGETVQLSPSNIALYRRIINVYEENDYTEKGGKFYVDGKEISEYTFKQDYFWAMGDNRHNSEDSRAWGFVPYDHIVGKPLFIWFSTKNGSIFNGINFSRIFRKADID